MIDKGVDRSYPTSLRVAILILAGLCALLLLAAGSFMVSHARPLQQNPETFKSFQDGVSPHSSYLGTRDTYIQVKSPNTSHGGEIKLAVSGGASTTDYSNALLRWDISEIPSISTIRAVTVTLYISQTSAFPYKIYQVKKDWDENLATWNQAAPGYPWYIPGLIGGPDAGISALAVFTASYSISPGGGLIEIPLNDSGVAVVQSWVNAPSNNLGLIISSYTNPAIPAVFLSRETGILAYRPKLTIKYITPATAFVITATASKVGATAATAQASVTATATAAATPTATSIATAGATNPATIPAEALSVTPLLSTEIMATTASQPAGGGAAIVLPPTGGREAPTGPARIFIVALGIGALLILIGLAGVIFGLFYRKRHMTWADWLTRTGIYLMAAGLIFGLVAFFIWLAAKPAPTVAVETGQAAPPTTDQGQVTGTASLADLLNTPTPLTLPDYTAPTPTLQGTLAPGEEIPDLTPPIQIEIPTLGLNAVVKYVPLLGQSWLIGGLKQEVAWMGDTSWPGLGKNTALTAHVTLPDGSDGPFRNLADLKSGDVIVLSTQENNYIYRVRQLKTVSESDLSVLEPEDGATLTLITCTDWSKTLNKYLSRLAAMADLEKVEPITQAP